MTESRSIVQYYGEQKAYKCGYCKEYKCNSYGMWAEILTATDYQALIDRGWRRSGQYCYKPNNKVTCCTSYTIKSDATNFKLSKSQKKVIKHLNKFLLTGYYKEEIKDKIVTQKCSDGVDNIFVSKYVSDFHNSACALILHSKQPHDEILDIKIDENNKLQQGCTSSLQNKEDNRKSVTGPDISKPLKKKSKILRQEKRMLKINNSESSKSINAGLTVVNGPKTLKEFLIDECPNNGRYKLDVILVSPCQDIELSFQLFCKYQTIIHNDKPNKLTLDHYKQFLISSPIISHKEGPGPGYGTFHQQYWLSGKLIAVGVIDILPYCVSSVYFFYDPDYNHLSLGTYSSLREIQLVQDLRCLDAQLSNYYMGFYIHTCPKMVYKRKIQPSYILCPETYTWHLLNINILHKLDINTYQRLCTDPTAHDEDQLTSKMKLALKNSASKLECGHLIGQILLQRMLICE